MILSPYLYSLFIFLAICSLLYVFLNFRHGKEEINNKILLKNMLEGFDLDLPEELKALDTTSTDTQKLS